MVNDEVMVQVVFTRWNANDPDKVRDVIDASFFQTRPLSEAREVWEHEGQEVVSSVSLDPKWQDSAALDILGSLVALSADEDAVGPLLDELLTRAFNAGREFQRDEDMFERDRFDDDGANSDAPPSEPVPAPPPRSELGRSDDDWSADD